MSGTVNTTVTKVFAADGQHRKRPTHGHLPRTSRMRGSVALVVGFLHLSVFLCYQQRTVALFVQQQRDALAGAIPSVSSQSRPFPRVFYVEEGDEPRRASLPFFPCRSVKRYGYESEPSDETELLPLLDSSDGSNRGVFRRQELPRQPEECVPYHDWQTNSFPNCDSMHELDLRLTFVELAWHKLGGKHYMWKMGRFALRPLRFDRNFTKMEYESTRIDHLAMERLTSSKHTLALYGYCGATTLTELATEKTLCRVLKNESVSSRDKLDYAIDIARGYVDLHSIGCDSPPVKNDGTYEIVPCNGTIVHQDGFCSNYLLARDGKLKLNDFNGGKILYWNTNTSRPCGYRSSKDSCRGDSKPRCNSKSPEEYGVEGMLTEKVDTFLLGSSLFHLLTDRRPYEAENGEAQLTSTEVRRRILDNIEPKLPISILNSTDPYVWAIATAMRRARNPDAEKRPSMREIANYLVLERAGLAAKEVWDQPEAS